ncbi:TPA: hypothetical protein ACGGR7_003581 [Vibrio cholerae]
MVAVVVFEFSGMRCQPLRRALCLFFNILDRFNMKFVIFNLMLIVLFGCSAPIADKWEYSESVNHFEKRTFLETMYLDSSNGGENSGFTIACDKNGENEIFSKFVALKNEDYLLFPDIGSTTFQFVINDEVDIITSGLFTYDSEQKVFLGFTNVLPRELLYAIANPNFSNKQLHVRMSVRGVHIKWLRKALSEKNNLITNDAVASWIKDNVEHRGIVHNFEKHIDLKGLSQYMKYYDGCTFARK